METKVWQQDETDRRYRVLVLLARSDKPTNWNFVCPRCSRPLFENIVNADMVEMTDMVDMNDTSNVLVGRRCDGHFQGGRCGIYYYFKVQS
jgi:hypothetical protein